MVVERKLRIIKYWLKIVCNETSLLVSQSYNTLYRDIVANGRGVNWATAVRGLLCDLGFGEVWYFFDRRLYSFHVDSNVECPYRLYAVWHVRLSPCNTSWAGVTVLP